MSIMLSGFKSSKPAATANASGTKTYTFKEQGFSVDLPQSWEQLQPMKAIFGTSMAIFNIKCKDISNCPTVALAATPNDTVSLEEHTKYILKRIKSKYNNTVVIKKEYKTINSIPASIIEYTGTKKFVEKRVHIIMAMYEN